MLPLIALFAQTPDLRRTMAAGPTDAVLISPPQPICVAEVLKMTWTADGNYLVVERRTPDSKLNDAELLVWGRLSGRARTITHFDFRTTSIQEIEPMGDSDRFVVQELDVVREGPSPGTYQRISLVSASSGAVMPIGSVRQSLNSPLLTALVSPSRPFGILERIDDSTKTCRVFGADGKLEAEVAVVRTDGLMWDGEGYPIQIHRLDAAAGKPGGLLSRRVDPASGKVGEWKLWTYPRPKTEASSFIVQTVTAGSIKGVRAPSILLGLPGGKDDECAVVSTDGTNPLLAPKGEAIAYVD